MEKIKRKIEVESREVYQLDSYGYNSKGTFTMACKDGTIFNINGVELEGLKKFLENRK